MKKNFTTAAGSGKLPENFRQELEEAITNFLNTELSEFAEVPDMECEVTLHTETACLGFKHPGMESKMFCAQMTDAGTPLSVDVIITDLTSRKIGKTLKKAMSVAAA